MSGPSEVGSRLEEAIGLRRSGETERALEMLLDLVAEHPDDATINLQTAWAHDKLGLETEAVPFYEKALSMGLEGQDLHDALLGLGSTLRALGRYAEAEETLRRAKAEFPDDNGASVFHSLSLYNNGQPKAALEQMLSTLLTTTADESILRYRAALETYGEDLDRTWA